MFFSGDSSRKRVDLGGRSSKERDRQVLLEQTRMERKRRQGLRQQTTAAIKIQKYFRGRKEVEVERARARMVFSQTYGQPLQNVDWHCFGPDSAFLRYLLFFFNAKDKNDVDVLIEACRLLLQYVRLGGNIVSLFAGEGKTSPMSFVNNRVKKLAFFCLQAVHHNRDHWKDQLFLSSQYSEMPTIILLETVAHLMRPDLPWVCKVVDHLVRGKVFSLLREMVLFGMQSVKTPESRNLASSLEHVIMLAASHISQQPCNCSSIEPRWSFSSQLLSIPFFWNHLPFLKEAFSTHGLGTHYIHQMALCLPSHASVLPPDISPEYPGYACLLGNLLEAASDALSLPSCNFHVAMDFLAVSTFLLEALPASKLSAREKSNENDMVLDEESIGTLDSDLGKQISNAVDSRLLQHLVNVLFRDTSLINSLEKDVPSDREVEATGAICAFLHVIFNTLPIERIMTGLAYRTEIVRVLWRFIKRSHENHRWPSSSKFTGYLSGDAPGWLLPSAVFCPVYKHMLMIVDNEEFYEQEKPLSLKDIRLLITILKQALWQLLWTIPSNLPSQKSLVGLSGQKKLSMEFMRYRVGIVISELLSQLQDWNNRRAFTSSVDFQSQEASSENFISQALLGNSKASEILKQAPFLVPFTSRVRIFTSQLAASKERNGAGLHPGLGRSRFKIRRDRILEDAFSQLSALSEEDLRGLIRVSFVNELGVEEAGIDGGGIFKDFMENITHVAFDVQYGLFKETSDHQLYPNPGSGLIHEQHLQFFHFLGSLLGKAMYEGILVDLPFAMFFLSKLKQKYNYLNDLPSLDPELYRHLLFLKHYQGDISELELYFVVVNNEYGEQTEEDLLPGGKDTRVTNENVITYIHLIANHRLNYQIRHQSLHFLRGFQQLIQKEWIEMFSEHEIQLLISGSLESLDVDDLRSNAHYSGGYHLDHRVIVMFWEVLKSFSLEHQKKFLKFVTGCSRGPLLGFKYLEPKFCIQRAAPLNATEDDLDRLPTSATCMNLLKLPPYRSKEQMQSKLLYAINAEAGFDLS
ncbi:E3 ubiquitin-protein ligase UPL6-like [Dioscorea cayenensis subsp. rotundata]|uniref:HECT-type E3 ubiquitin transferase n=1 Tax=Dioscorea cayennensis subsp. rotundata TaxID=55577 RepID=A0AB40BIQ9_DIOCR|nr:E3 ubiquitin-protein ligase UPL6-like [Dioscorea cayenensis subsp. rotundata]